MSKYSGPLGSYAAAVIDQTRLWVPTPAMNALIRNLSNINPATVAGRQQIGDALSTLIGASPYGIVDGQTQLVDLRFSTNTNTGTPLTAASYVATFRDGWSEVFTQLTSAAIFKDRDGEKVINSGLAPAASANPDAMRSQYNDATLSVKKAIQSAQTMLSNCTGVYNYHTFEDTYQLTWGTTTEPPPFHFSAGPRQSVMSLGELEAAFQLASSIFDQSKRAEFLRSYVAAAAHHRRTDQLFDIMSSNQPQQTIPPESVLSHK